MSQGNKYSEGLQERERQKEKNNSRRGGQAHLDKPVIERKVHQKERKGTLEGRQAALLHIGIFLTLKCVLFPLQALRTRSSKWEFHADEAKQEMSHE